MIAIVVPIETLTDDVSAITEGEMTRRSSIDSDDELGDLGRAFNRMADTITERGEALRESQARLLHSQKMEALGQLAGGIAHDFNNYLQVIIAHAGLVRDALESGSIEQADADEVLAAADRATALARQILVFSRKQVVERRVVDINATIRASLRMLTRIAGDDRVLTHALEAEPMPVLLDAGEFEQVLVNLVANARDATHRNGRITITSSIAADTPDSVNDGPAHAVVIVGDDGDGMSASVRDRIFDPFFTTKARGHGTGLGLAIVYGIVEQAGGTITVESAPGQGTVFRIVLPITTAPAHPTPLREAEIGVAHGDDLVVLVVDDDPAVLRSAQRLLEQAGYQARAVSDGTAALTALDHEPIIDVLLTDVMMPDVTGPELAAAVRARRPDLPVVFMTGYVDDDTLRREFGERIEHCLRKPFTMAALSSAIQEALCRVAPPATGERGE
jgi:signal transduction histidine kinase/ActR/RegA family two-component response regulator